MPELPEVEVVRLGLEKILTPQSGPALMVDKIEFLRPDLRFPIPQQELLDFVGQKIIGIQRRAKYLLIEFKEAYLLSHLGMTGTWRFEKSSLKVPHKTHDHIRIYLSQGWVMIYHDPRRFGFVDCVKKTSILSHPRLVHLGPEPLLPEFNAKYLKQTLIRRQTLIKPTLMNQEVVVGVGNIYASESLYLAKVSPLKRAAKVTLRDCEKIVESIQFVLQKSIAKGGSSISDFKQSSGESGYFQNEFSVYGRGGESCLHCKTKIKSKMILGRNTFWCPRCQKS